METLLDEQYAPLTGEIGFLELSIMVWSRPG
jgi:hypothetical protein